MKDWIATRIALGAVVNWVIVLAHSNSTELLFDYDMAKMIGIKVALCWLSDLISFLNISITINWKMSPISETGSSVYMIEFRKVKALS